MVVGLRIVSWGVFSLGVEGPNAAIELGTIILVNSCSLAISRVLYRPFMFTLYANWGCFSPTADRIAAIR